MVFAEDVGTRESTNRKCPAGEACSKGREGQQEP